MQHRHTLLYVLSAIVLLNVIVLVIMQNRAVEEIEELPVAESPAPIVVAKPLVRTLILEGECTDCYDIRKYVAELEDVLNMSVEDASPDVFRLDRRPALAFSQAVEEYPDGFIDGWEGFGSVQEIPDGEYAGVWYVLPTMTPPYLDVATGRTRGLVNVTYITMDSCGECYDVRLNDQFMEESRIVVADQRFVDAESPVGGALMSRYGITKVPTIIMDAEAGVYANMQPGWPVVGTIEPDGSYVLRELHRLRVIYYDVEEERVMRP